MNRIILIGNGFDLAHEMPTSYRNFIDDYWTKVAEQIKRNIPNLQTHRSKLQLFTNDDLQITCEYAHMRVVCLKLENSKITSYKEFNDTIKSLKQTQIYESPVIIEVNFTNKFLEHISEQVNLQQWVDIENEYYKALTELIDSTNSLNIETLNNNLKSIEKSLTQYLTEIEQNHFDNEIISKIKSNIYSKFNIKDMSLRFIDSFVQEVESKITIIKDKGIDRFNDYKKVYNLNSNEAEIINFCILNMNKKDKQKIEIQDIPDYFLVPERTLFLSFNYTHTEEKYTEHNSDIVETIHIHGELNKENNPIIFGYGNEQDDDYRKLEKLHDDKYLENIKSIRYLETENYKKLLNFIETDPYQIFIMGHSCGTSDKTLLNTLLEHKNCASIKPFYYKPNETEDNYSSIVKGISRNFNDKILMRDRVVNKTFCKTLNG